MGPPQDFPMGPPPYMGAGPSHATDAPYAGQSFDADDAFTMDDLYEDDATAAFDIIGPSQLPGAPYNPHRPPCQTHVLSAPQVLQIV